MTQSIHRPIRALLTAITLLLGPTISYGADAPTPASMEETPTAASRERPLSSEAPVVFSAHWDNDVISNLQGGIKRGTRLDSTAQAGVTINGNQIGLPGATFHAALFAMRTGRASSELVGDSLGVSNIEGAQSRLILSNAYWAQEWCPWLSTQVGMFDINSVFDATDSASQLINGSFGPDPGMTGNFAAPTFPLNGSGVIVTLNQGPWAVHAGAFQGGVDHQTQPFNQGTLNVVEGNWLPSDGQAIKLGLWQRRGDGQTDMRGLYVSAEQPLTANGRLIGFARGGVTRADQINDLSLRHYLSAGFNWEGALPGRPKDHLTIGVTRAALNTDMGQRHEQVAEAAYIFRINSHLFLQPDLQYIDRPSGTYPAAWVATLRIHIE